MACSLIRTLRFDEDDPGRPKVSGRIVTTVPKAKELRPFVERLITLGKKAAEHEERAAEFAISADRNSSEYKSWRESDKWRQWAAAKAPSINLRRKAFALLRDNEAVDILFDELAERFADRAGGYTRVVKLAKVRLGDGGEQALIEFVGENDRKKTKRAAPKVTEETLPVKEETEDADAAPAAAAAAAEAGDTAETDTDEPDDFTKIEGIGPAVTKALHAVGINTYRELAAKTEEELQTILTEGDGNFAGQKPGTWPKQAEMADAGQWDELKKWQDELDGGVES